MMQLKTNNNHSILFGFIAVLATALLIFSNMEGLPIVLWDESRNAINAIEMSRSNNWWVTTFNGEPEMWNTKPALLLWMQAACIKMFGIRPLALRLPIAITVLITSIVMFRFILKTLKSPFIAFASVLVLITTQGYLTFHVARTGDYDALLILFLLLGSFNFYEYINTAKNKNLYFTFIFFALAVLTKGIAGLMFGPALVIYAISEKKFLSLLKNLHLYLGLILFSAISLSYYFIREQYNPGFLQAVIDNELFGRYVSTKEKNAFPIYYYFVELFRNQFTYWITLFIIGIGAGRLLEHEEQKRLTKFSLIIIFIFLIILSGSKTKIIWYMAPVYPFTAIIAAIGINFVWIKLQSINTNNTKLSLRILPLVCIFFIFVLAYFEVFIIQVKKASRPNDDFQQYTISNMMYQEIKGNTGLLNNAKLITEGYAPNVLFYKEMALDRGITITKIRKDQIQSGDKVITFLPINDIVDTTKYIVTPIKEVLMEKPNDIYNNVHVGMYSINAKSPIPLSSD